MDDTKKCDGHCENCNINQRSYCAAQMAYYNQQEIAEIKSFLMRKTDDTINPISREDNAPKGLNSVLGE